MSASLVGSEMCIRDSVRCLHDEGSVVGEFDLAKPGASASELSKVTTLDACLLYTSDAADDM
eukprot:5909070-Alexandrium_andersonii.AAC.1